MYYIVFRTCMRSILYCTVGTVHTIPAACPVSSSCCAAKPLKICSRDVWLKAYSPMHSSTPLSWYCAYKRQGWESRGDGGGGMDGNVGALELLFSPLYAVKGDMNVDKGGELWHAFICLEEELKEQPGAGADRSHLQNLHVSPLRVLGTSATQRPVPTNTTAVPVTETTDGQQQQTHSFRPRRCWAVARSTCLARHVYGFHFYKGVM